jgi:hypothetical protein
MLASVSQAMASLSQESFCPLVRFDDHPGVTRFKARGNLRPLGNNTTAGKVTFPWGHPFDFDATAANDAALVGAMLAGPVSNRLQGLNCKSLILAKMSVSLRESLPLRLNVKMT